MVHARRCAFMPLDPGWPAERLRSIAASARSLAALHCTDTLPLAVAAAVFSCPTASLPSGQLLHVLRPSPAGNSGVQVA